MCRHQNSCPLKAMCPNHRAIDDMPVNQQAGVRILIRGSVASEIERYRAAKEY